jgi:hypothetical protein
MHTQHGHLKLLAHTHAAPVSILPHNSSQDPIIKNLNKSADTNPSGTDKTSSSQDMKAARLRSRCFATETVFIDTGNVANDVLSLSLVTNTPNWQIIMEDTAFEQDPQRIKMG